MNIVIVAHKFLTQPDDELVIFLNENKFKKVLHIMHSFSDCSDRKSYFRYYESGELVQETFGKDYKYLPEPIIYLKELFFTLNAILFHRSKFDIYIGMDGMCVLFGQLAKIVFRVKKVVFWSIDFVPNSRFKQYWKNFIYKTINYYGYKKADEVWDLSPRMFEARKKFLKISLADYKFRQVVPYGMWVDRVKKHSYEEVDPYTIVFMGHLLEKQGVQLILNSLPEIIKLYPQIKFKIIGDGSYKESLILLAKKLNIEDHCYFMGKIDNIRELEKEVAKSTIAVAPYIKSLDKWTYYADPGKIKTYLACGVPVILTDLSWNAKEIELNKCGLIIEDSVKSITNSIFFLLNKENNKEFRENAVEYSKSFNYSNIFRKIKIFQLE